MRSRTASVAWSAPVVSGWSDRHWTMRMAARWKVSFGVKPGTNRLILLVSNTAVPPVQATADSNGGAEASDTGEPTEDADVPATDTPPAPTPSQAAALEKIADCESGGDPTAISPTGRYRGKYQFDRRTWQHMGGSGDPAAAPEAEQDARAAQLLAKRGTAPWPVCG